MTNVLILIPARGGSKGLPHKNTLKLGGKSLIERAVDTAQEAIDNNKDPDLQITCAVSSDSLEILTKAVQQGAYALSRTGGYASDSATSEDVMNHALTHMKSVFSITPDILILMQCTTPFTRAEHIRDVIKPIYREEANAAFTAYRTHAKLWHQIPIRDSDTRPEVNPANHNPALRLPRQADKPQFCENGGLYGVSVEAFFTQNTRFALPTQIAEVYQLPHGLEIDTMDDYLLAQMVYEKEEDE